MRKILSVVVAALLTVVGLAALWYGAAVAFQALVGAQADGTLVLGVLVVIVGSLVLAAAAASVALSSAGVIIVGALHLVAGLLYVLVPFQSGGIPSPMFSIIIGLGDVSRELSDGAFLFIGAGLSLVLGSAMLAVGIGAAARSRRQFGAPPVGSPIAVRVVSALVGTVLILLLTGLAIGLGSTVYRNTTMLLRFDMLPVALLIVAVLVLGGVLLVTRWTSLAAIGSGAALTLFGVVGVFAPLAAYRALPPDAAIAISRVTQTGFLLAIGLSILALGLGAAVRSRRVAPTASV
jgi:hypothetical protein